MKNVRILLLLTLVVVALSLAPKLIFAQTSLDETLQPYLGRYGLPALAVAVAKNGEIVAAGAVGTRRAGVEIPVSLDDRFHIGSDTKAMTALLASILAEEGKLSWNATPAKVFTEFASAMDAGFAKVTLEQLLSHTSGLPSDNEDIGVVWNQAQLQEGNLDAMRLFIVREWSKKPLASTPGKRFEYSNMGYIVAGAMIERVTGTTWDELIVERVFLPLGLTTAGLGCQSSLGKMDAPLGHAIIDGNTKSFLAGPNGDNQAILGPAGIANMSILDFARWASWNAGQGKRGPALVRAETVRKLQTPVIQLTPRSDAQPGTPQIKGGYGLGWGVVEVDFARHPLLHHGGSNGKNLAHIWVDVENDLAIVIATNIGGKKAEDAMAPLVRELYAKYARTL